MLGGVAFNGLEYEISVGRIGHKNIIVQRKISLFHMIDVDLAKQRLDVLCKRDSHRNNLLRMRAPDGAVTPSGDHYTPV